MGIHVTNDLTAPWQGTARWSLETLAGEVLAFGEEEVQAAPLASTHVRTLDWAGRISDDNCREVILVGELEGEGEWAALYVATFVPDKHLSLADPELAVDVRRDGRRMIVVLEAKSLARFVELALAGTDVVFSDNYFDLPAGRAVTVSCPWPADWTVEQARAALRVRSLYRSFA